MKNDIELINGILTGMFPEELITKVSKNELLSTKEVKINGVKIVEPKIGVDKIWLLTTNELKVEEDNAKQVKTVELKIVEDTVFMTDDINLVGKEERGCSLVDEVEVTSNNDTLSWVREKSY